MMLHFAPDAVECALLYDAEYADVDFDDLLGYLNAAFMAPGQRFERASMPEIPHSRMYAGHNLFVLVSQNHHALEMDGFTGALRSAYTSLFLNDADIRVAHHKANIFITVSTLPPLPDHPLLEEIGYKGLPPKQTVANFETKLMLCRILAGYIAKQRNPSAVHWCQSNTLLSTEAFLDAVDEKEPTWLHLHPGFYSPGIDNEGRQILGATMNISAQLINYTLSFKPAPVPPAYIVERLANFVDMVRLRGGDPIPDGESFGADNSEIIRVRHIKAPGDEPGEIELVLEQQDEMGIAPELPEAVEPRSSSQPEAIPSDSPARNAEFTADAARVAPTAERAPDVVTPASDGTGDRPVLESTEPVVASNQTESTLIWSSSDPVAEVREVPRQKITRANAPKPQMPEATAAKQSLLSRLRSLGR